MFTDVRAYRDYIRDNPEGYWFKNKMYGFGWTPARWQGWVVTLGFGVAVAYSAFQLDPNVSDHELFTVFLPKVGGWALLFMIIAWRTGEPLQWRWGIPKKGITGK
jgi:hypothetical protein